MEQRKLVQYIPQSPPLLPPTQSLPFDSSSFDKVSPSILIITIMLAIIFFISGLLHLLIRFLLRPPSNRRESEEGLNNVTALHGQLQQLFHLHDAGVDQSLIDNLPVFHYKSITGVNETFDCAVCLCEFEDEDALRLLPNCSHAFHMECIDTWLLAHSTCPLCRASLLLLDLSVINNRSSPPPFVNNVHESGMTESSTEIVTDRENVVRSNSDLGLCEDSGEKVVAVKLGKLRNVDDIEGCSTSDSDSDNNNNNVDSRRCFSMGSFEYVMDENSLLQVSIRRTSLKKPSRKNKKNRLPLTPGQRTAMSECDCESRRGFNGFEPTSITDNNNSEAIGKKSKKESVSISKIWLREKKEKQSFGIGVDSSRRAFSFRYPQQQVDSLNGSCSTINNNGKAIGCCDEENQRCHSLDSETKTPSFARRSLVWLAGPGRQNKVVHSTFSPNM